MEVLVTGAAGMVGRKLVERLARDGTVAGREIGKLTLTDIVAPPAPSGFAGEIESRAEDFSAPGVAAALVASRPAVIFHLAAIISGEAERDFDKGYRINLDGTRNLLEAIRHEGGADYVPKLVFASSSGVFGAPFPPAIPDEFHVTPLTSYGTQKAIGELLLADYTRRGFIEGVGIRFPSIVVRPGKPNASAGGFFSGIIREPLQGQEALLPVGEEVVFTHASPRSAVGFLLHAAGLRRERTRSAHQPVDAGRVLQRRRADRGAAPRRRREGGQADPPRAGQGRKRHRRRLADPLRRRTGAGARLPGRTRFRRDHPYPYRG